MSQGFYSTVGFTPSIAIEELSSLINDADVANSTIDKLWPTKFYFPIALFDQHNTN